MIEIIDRIQRSVGRVQREGRNPHFNSSYMTLEGVFEAVLPVLEEHEVGLTQTPVVVDGQQALRTVFEHIPTGDTFEGTLLLNGAQGNPQAQGSGLTYARRYSVVTMLNILSEDDDGNAASPPPRSRSEATQRRSNGTRGRSQEETQAAW